MEILTNLTGVSFRPASAKQLVDTLGMNQELGLERDPGNAYDSNAVKVIYDFITDEGETISEFIGFIPATDNAEVAAHLDEGGDYTCTVCSFLGKWKPGLKIELINYDPTDGLD